MRADAAACGARSAAQAYLRVTKHRTDRIRVHVGHLQQKRQRARRLLAPHVSRPQHADRGALRRTRCHSLAMPGLRPVGCRLWRRLSRTDFHTGRRRGRPLCGRSSVMLLDGPHRCPRLHLRLPARLVRCAALRFGEGAHALAACPRPLRLLPLPAHLGACLPQLGDQGFWELQRRQVVLSPRIAIHRSRVKRPVLTRPAPRRYSAAWQCGGLRVADD